jgi:cytochrome b6-f complex iron-sulfur subunit
MRRVSMAQDRTIDPVGRPMTRNRFIRLLLGWAGVSSLAMVAAPVIGFLIPSKRSVAGGAGGRFLAGTTAEIGPGRGKVVALGAKPVIVLNGPQGVKAFSAVCTHLGCIVGYDATKSPDIVSPCHDGHFDAVNGRVISGPPPAPLKEYLVAVEKDQIYLAGA